MHYITIRKDRVHANKYAQSRKRLVRQMLPHKGCWLIITQNHIVNCFDPEACSEDSMPCNHIGEAPCGCQRTLLSDESVYTRSIYCRSQKELSALAQPRAPLGSRQDCKETSRFRILHHPRKCMDGNHESRIFVSNRAQRTSYEKGRVVRDCLQCNSGPINLALQSDNHRSQPALQSDTNLFNQALSHSPMIRIEIGVPIKYSHGAGRGHPRSH